MDPPIHNPVVPYVGYINGGFRAGRSVRIQGRVSPSCNRFTINLQCGPNSSHDDIALHLDVRFNENCLVRNSRSYGSWGSEERHGHFPFARGQHFEIMIMSDPVQFKIAANGSHLAEFNHLVPADRITHISVEGDVTLTLIQFDGAGAPPSGGNFSASAPPLTGAPPPYGGGGGAGFVAPPYPPAGASPYPPFGGSPYPPAGGSPYPPGGAPGYPAAPPQAYGAPGYQMPPGGSPYPAGPPAGSPYPQQPGYGHGAYPTQPGYGAPPPGGQPPYGYPSAYPSQPHKSGGGLLDNAGKLLAGGLAGVGLAKVANKIPGMGGHGHHGGHGYPQAHGHGHSGGGMGGLGGALGTAAALGATGLVANKALKKGKKNKLLKYGLPAAGLGVGGYAISKGMKKGFHRGSSSSSSSSSSEEE